MPLQTGNNRIGLDVQNTENTGGPALFRQQGEAVLDGFTGAAVEAGLVIQRNDAFLTGADAEDTFQRLGTSGGIQTGKAQNLTSAGIEGNVTKLVVHAGQTVHLQIHIAGHIG